MSPSGKIKKSQPPLHFPFMQEENRLSMAMENYLLSILRLEEQEIKVTVVGLSDHFKNLPKAEGLGTSLPSVSAMVRRLSREQLVETGPNKEIQFTKLGLQSAQSILRRHRLAARLAVDVLGVELKYAYREAHRLEHAISPYLEHRIIEILQHPTTCPFGHPIPGSAYKKPKKLISLSNAKTDTSYIVNRIPEDDENLVSYFVENGFLPDQKIKLKNVSDSRGVVVVSCLESELVFGFQVAEMIWISDSEENL